MLTAREAKTLAQYTSGGAHTHTHSRMTLRVYDVKQALSSFGSSSGPRSVLCFVGREVEEQKRTSVGRVVFFVVGVLWAPLLLEPRAALAGANSAPPFLKLKIRFLTFNKGRIV